MITCDCSTRDFPLRRKRILREPTPFPPILSPFFRDVVCKSYRTRTFELCTHGSTTRGDIDHVRTRSDCPVVQTVSRDTDRLRTRRRVEKTRAETTKNPRKFRSDGRTVDAQRCTEQRENVWTPTGTHTRVRNALGRPVRISRSPVSPFCSSRVSYDRGEKFHFFFFFQYRYDASTRTARVTETLDSR